MLMPLLSAAQLHQVSDMPLFEQRLKDCADKLTSIESNFTQIKHLDVFDENVTSTGMFYYLKDNKICMNYSKPLNYLIIINNNWLKIVADGKTNIMQLNSNKMMNEMQDMITACMVGDLKRMSTGYDVVYKEDDKQYVVLVTPKSKTVREYVSAIEISLNKADMSVDRLRMCENESDYTEYLFSNKHFNRLADDALFRIE